MQTVLRCAMLRRAARRQVQLPLHRAVERRHCQGLLHRVGRGPAVSYHPACHRRQLGGRGRVAGQPGGWLAGELGGGCGLGRPPAASWGGISCALLLKPVAAGGPWHVVGLRPAAVVHGWLGGRQGCRRVPVVHSFLFPYLEQAAQRAAGRRRSTPVAAYRPDPFFFTQHLSALSTLAGACLHAFFSRAAWQQASASCRLWVVLFSSRLQ